MNRFIILGVALMAVAAGAAGCKSLPRPSEIEPARTHIQSIRFDEPEDGLITADAELVIHNPGALKANIDEVEATLYRGAERLGKAHEGGDHDVPPRSTQTIRLNFRDIRVADLEKAIGRPLANVGAEEFDVEGVIVYKSSEGPVRHAFGRLRIMTPLGPKGSRS